MMITIIIMGHECERGTVWERNSGNGKKKRKGY
jgi:hypothetical protein